jgi:RNA polymerase sigma factor (sigma-70 family)
MSASDRQNEHEALEELFGSVFDLAGQVTARISRDQVEARLRRVLREAGRAGATPPAADSPLAALVGRATAGDQEAWNRIVERYAPLVYATCVRYRLGEHDVEDVGQRVWLLLVEQIGNLREPAALPGWLATTTSRECLRVLRTAQRSGPPEDPARLADAVVTRRVAEALAGARAAGIDAEILAAERNAALHAALAGLPARCRQLLSMLISDPPYSYAEISATLGIPVGSIGPHRTRCLNRLRQSMAPAPFRDDPGQAKPGLPPPPRWTPPRG